MHGVKSPNRDMRFFLRESFLNQKETVQDTNIVGPIVDNKRSSFSVSPYVGKIKTTISGIVDSIVSTTKTTFLPDPRCGSDISQYGYVPPIEIDMNALQAFVLCQEDVDGLNEMYDSGTGRKGVIMEGATKWTPCHQFLADGYGYSHQRDDSGQLSEIARSQDFYANPLCEIFSRSQATIELFERNGSQCVAQIEALMNPSSSVALSTDYFYFSYSVEDVEFVNLMMCFENYLLHRGLADDPSEVREFVFISEGGDRVVDIPKFSYTDPLWQLNNARDSQANEVLAVKYTLKGPFGEYTYTAQFLFSPAAGRKGEVLATGWAPDDNEGNQDERLVGYVQERIKDKRHILLADPPRGSRKATHLEKKKRDNLVGLVQDYEIENLFFLLINLGSNLKHPPIEGLGRRVRHGKSLTSSGNCETAVYYKCDPLVAVSPCVTQSHVDPTLQQEKLSKPAGAPRTWFTGFATVCPVCEDTYTTELCTKCSQAYGENDLIKIADMPPGKMQEICGIRDWLPKQVASMKVKVNFPSHILKGVNSSEYKRVLSERLRLIKSLIEARSRDDNSISDFLEFDCKIFNQYFITECERRFTNYPKHARGTFPKMLDYKVEARREEHNGYYDNVVNVNFMLKENIALPVLETEDDFNEVKKKFLQARKKRWLKKRKTMIQRPRESNKAFGNRVTREQEDYLYFSPHNSVKNYKISKEREDWNIEAFMQVVDVRFLKWFKTEMECARVALKRWTEDMTKVCLQKKWTNGKPSIHPSLAVKNGKGMSSRKECFKTIQRMDMVYPSHMTNPLMHPFLKECGAVNAEVSELGYRRVVHLDGKMKRVTRTRAEKECVNTDVDVTRQLEEVTTHTLEKLGIDFEQTKRFTPNDKVKAQATDNYKKTIVYYDVKADDEKMGVILDKLNSLGLTATIQDRMTPLIDNFLDTEIISSPTKRRAKIISEILRGPDRICMIPDGTKKAEHLHSIVVGEIDPNLLKVPAKDPEDSKDGHMRYILYNDLKDGAPDYIQKELRLKFEDQYGRALKTASGATARQAHNQLFDNILNLTRSPSLKLLEDKGCDKAMEIIDQAVRRLNAEGIMITPLRLEQAATVAISSGGHPTVIEIFEAAAESATNTVIRNKVRSGRPDLKVPPGSEYIITRNRDYGGRQVDNEDTEFMRQDLGRGDPSTKERQLLFKEVAYPDPESDLIIEQSVATPDMSFLERDKIVCLDPDTSHILERNRWLYPKPTLLSVPEKCSLPIGAHFHYDPDKEIKIFYPDKGWFDYYKAKIWFWSLFYDDYTEDVPGFVVTFHPYRDSFFIHSVANAAAELNMKNVKYFDDDGVVSDDLNLQYSISHTISKPLFTDDYREYTGTRKEKGEPHILKLSINNQNEGEENGRMTVEYSLSVVSTREDEIFKGNSHPIRGFNRTLVRPDVMQKIEADKICSQPNPFYTKAYYRLSYFIRSYFFPRQPYWLLLPNYDDVSFLRFSDIHGKSMKAKACKNSMIQKMKDEFFPKKLRYERLPYFKDDGTGFTMTEENGAIAVLEAIADGTQQFGCMKECKRMRDDSRNLIPSNKKAPESGLDYVASSLAGFGALLAGVFGARLVSDGSKILATTAIDAVRGGSADFRQNRVYYVTTPIVLFGAMWNFLPSIKDHVSNWGQSAISAGSAAIEGLGSSLCFFLTSLGLQRVASGYSNFLPSPTFSLSNLASAILNIFSVFSFIHIEDSGSHLAKFSQFIQVLSEELMDWVYRVPAACVETAVNVYHNGLELSSFSSLALHSFNLALSYVPQLFSNNLHVTIAAFSMLACRIIIHMFYNMGYTVELPSMAWLSQLFETSQPSGGYIVRISNIPDDIDLNKMFEDLTIHDYERSKLNEAEGAVTLSITQEQAGYLYQHRHELEYNGRNLELYFYNPQEVQQSLKDEDLGEEVFDLP